MRIVRNKYTMGKLKCKYSYYGTSYVMVSTVFQRARVLKFNGEMGSLYIGPFSSCTFVIVEVTCLSFG